MINIENKRECFFDDFLINNEKTTAERRLHKLIRKNVLMVMDKPWEGKYTTFFCPLYAEGKWKLYYTSTLDMDRKYVCYAESKNGEDWVRPNLGIVEFEGSKNNNIIFDMDMFKELDFINFDNFSVFYDENPLCPPDEKYKMIASWIGHKALIALMSSDGIHYSNPRVIATDGHFDSQNRVFWSKEHNKYFCYFRYGHKPGDNVEWMDKSYSDRVALENSDPVKFLLHEPGDKSNAFMRDIRVIESEDFINWTSQEMINTTGAEFQLYNNVIFPYPRAPHILIGFPLRYVERKEWTKNYDELCGLEKRKERARSLFRFGLAVSDGLFMSSRNGHDFTKYDEALIPPPPENPEAFVYGDGTASPALIEIPSEIPGADNEYMIIVRENFRAVEGHNQIVKYTSRLDGFVSLHAGGETATIVTKEFTYSGESLYANLETSARGYAYFTLVCDGKEYTSVEMFGNSTDKRIRFEDDDIIKKLSEKLITLKIKMYDCDIYSIQFK